MELVLVITGVVLSVIGFAVMVHYKKNIDRLESHWFYNSFFILFVGLALTFSFFSALPAVEGRDVRASIVTLVAIVGALFVTTLITLLIHRKRV